MAFEHKPNSGSIFRNERKETDTHPDYTGSAKIDDVEYWISGWVNTSQAGKRYMSLKFRTKDKQPTSAAAPADFADDDDIPF